MNILVVGSNGQLGNELKVASARFPEWNFIFKDLPEIDITDFDSLKSTISKNTPSFIINCAAYTQVDKAEEEQELAYKINATGPENIAIIAEDNNCDLIHISTDFIFEGTKNTPYIESDETKPISAYGKTKIEGEEKVLANCNKAIIIRTSWLYSNFGNNFVKTMLKLGKERNSLNVIYDQIGTPTFAANLADIVLQIISYNTNDTPKYGVYHYSNEGTASWYDFAKAIFDISKINCKVYPISTSQYALPAKRPKYSVMDKTKIKTDFNIEIPYWRDSLINCLNRM